MRSLLLGCSVVLLCAVAAAQTPPRSFPGAEVRPLIDQLEQIDQKGMVRDSVPQFGEQFSSAVRWLKQARVPDQVPETLVRSLKTDIALLTGKSSPKGREFAVEDVIWKGQLCRQSPEGLGAGVSVSVRTLVETKESPGWEVVFKTAPEMEDPSIPPIPFPKFSSPTDNKLPAGRYVFWARDSNDAKRSGPNRQVPVQQQSVTIDLTAPK